MLAKNFFDICISSKYSRDVVYSTVLFVKLIEHMDYIVFVAYFTRVLFFVVVMLTLRARLS